MKKRISLILILILLASVFSGCGAKSVAEDTAAFEPESNGVYYEEAYSYKAEAPEAPMEAEAASEQANLFTTSTPSQPEEAKTKKIIHTGHVSLETLEFDKSIETLKSLVTECGGYIESSDISGNGFVEENEGYVSCRYAEFVLRVPCDYYESFQDSFTEIGYVRSFGDNVEDITRSYYDTETRLKAYQAEAETLTGMLKKTENVSELLEIQARLSEVTYMIDSLTSSLRGMQDQVDYSTFTVSLREVQKIVEDRPTPLNYWQRMKQGIRSTLEDIGEFFTDLFLWLIVNLPILLIVAAIIFVLVLLCRKRIKKRKQKKILKKQAKEASENKNEE